MRWLSIGLLFLITSGARADDSARARLGTLRVHAWLGAPSMPPISLTRGPLQQIIAAIEPEDVRTAAYAWEDDITRHRRLARAAREAVQELERHYEHQVLIRPDEVVDLRARLASERTRLRKRFRQEASERTARLRASESAMLVHLHQTASKRGPGFAAAQLLIAEVALARQRQTQASMLFRWEAGHQDFLRGEVPEDPVRPQPYLDPVIEALERIGTLAPNRLTRERAAQLLAVVLEENGEPERAVTTLSAALKNRVGWALRAELRNRLGDLLLGQARFAGAARQYGAVRESDGSWRVRAQLGLAWCRHRSGDDDGALRAVREVRRQLEGTFDGSAMALNAEADRLYAQLLADGVRGLPAGLTPRLRESIRGLRERRATMMPADDRDHARAPSTARITRAVTRRIAPIRDCYRRFLRRSDVGSVRGVLSLPPGGAASLLTLSTADRRLRACLEGAVATIRIPRQASAAMLTLELQPEACVH